MTSRNTIEDKKMLELIKAYCSLRHAEPRETKIPVFTEYIAEKGYPYYHVEAFRQNGKDRACIDALNQAVEKLTAANEKKITAKSYYYILRDMFEVLYDL